MKRKKVLPALQRINSTSVVISERQSCNCFICPRMSFLQYSSEIISSTKVSFPRGMIGPQFDPRVSPKLHFSILNQQPSVNALNARSLAKTGQVQRFKFISVDLIFRTIVPEIDEPSAVHQMHRSARSKQIR